MSQPCLGCQELTRDNDRLRETVAALREQLRVSQFERRAFVNVAAKLVAEDVKNKEQPE